jgi:hypothetical protein
MSHSSDTNEPQKSPLPDEQAVREELVMQDTIEGAACSPDLSTEQDIAEMETLERAAYPHENDLTVRETVKTEASPQGESHSDDITKAETIKRATFGVDDLPEDVAEAKTVKNQAVLSQEEVADIETVHSPACTVQSNDIAQAETVEQAAYPQEDVSKMETAEGAACRPLHPLEEVTEAETQESAACFIEEEDITQAKTVKSAIPNATQQEEPRTRPRPVLLKGVPSRLKRFLLVEDPQHRLLRILLLIGLLLPTLLILVDAVSILVIYSRARSGMQHLLQVKEIVTTTGATGPLDSRNLNRAQEEFTAASADFQQVYSMLNRAVLANVLPRHLTSARALSKIGVNVADMGRELTKAAQQLAPTLRESLILQNPPGGSKQEKSKKSSSFAPGQDEKPLVTPAMLTLIRDTLEYSLPRLAEVEELAPSVSLDTLPVSVEQREQLGMLLEMVPSLRMDLEQVDALLGAAGWLLGIHEARTFLVQTMDRAELRPTGGFTGQFGELYVRYGRVAPFELKNIGPFEENNPRSPVNGKRAPASFSWWPIPNWGLRDSNLSADFPTSARMAIDLYRYEFKRSVDGVIVFSPFLITRLLRILGPLSVPAYHETITAENMEERLHYYQLDNAGIRKEELIEHVEDPTLARKLFTARLAQILMERVRHISPEELVGIVREVLHALQTKDVQVYVTNPQVEAIFLKSGAAATINTTPLHDGLYIVQANVSASKASQYVRTRLKDTVYLDTRGGAKHVLQIQLVYNQIGSVYGLSTYRNYIRIYVPPASTFLWGSGFDNGEPLCGGPLPACAPSGNYPHQELICPTGQYYAGAATTMIDNPHAGQNHPLNKVGPPTNFQSDIAGRAMFGGWLVVPKNCTLTATLAWYVPALGNNSYSLLVQRQSSTFPELDLTILSPPEMCGKLEAAGKHVHEVLYGQDRLYTLTPTRTEAKCDGSLHVQG